MLGSASMQQVGSGSCSGFLLRFRFTNVLLETNSLKLVLRLLSALGACIAADSLGQIVTLSETSCK